MAVALFFVFVVVVVVVRLVCYTAVNTQRNRIYYHTNNLLSFGLTVHKFIHNKYLALLHVFIGSCNFRFRHFLLCSIDTNITHMWVYVSFSSCPCVYVCDSRSMPRSWNARSWSFAFMPVVESRTVSDLLFCFWKFASSRAIWRWLW